MLARLQAVRVHRQAHRAARLTPFKTGFEEDLVQPFGFRLGFNQPGTWHHNGLFDGRGHLAALGDHRRGAQVFDPRVGAGTDKHAVQLDVGDRLVGGQPHVFQGALDGATLDQVGLFGRVRHVLVDGQDHFGRSAPADLRLDLRSVEFDHGVEHRIGVGDQVFPRFDGGIPIGALRRERATLDVFDGFFVRRHHAHAGTGFDGHVADGHAAFNGQVADSTAGELDGMAVAAGGADLADHSQYDVLGGHAKRQLAFDAYQHVLHFLGHQALGGEHMFHLGRADAMGQGAERTVGGGVGVAADHGHARQGGALLRADDVDDALAHVVHLEFGDAVFVAIIVEGLHLQPRNLVGNGFDAALALRSGRHVVVRRGDDGVDAPRLAPGQSQAFERLGRGHFMDDVTVDIDQRRAIVAPFHFMGIPKLVVKRFAGHQSVLISGASIRRAFQ